MERSARLQNSFLPVSSSPRAPCARVVGPSGDCGREVVDGSTFAVRPLASTTGAATLLMPSTPSAHPQVISRTFAPFRVPRSAISAGQTDFHGGFDSRQLHNTTAAQEHKSWAVWAFYPSALREMEGLSRTTTHRRACSGSAQRGRFTNHSVGLSRRARPSYRVSAKSSLPTDVKCHRRGPANIDSAR